MSYLRFHTWFNLPLLLLLIVLNVHQPWDPADLRAIVLVLGLVLLFTTPWDNFAAKRGIWGFPPERYLWRLGYLPVEEYAFFILQSLNVMLAARLLLAWFPDWVLGQTAGLTTWTLEWLAISTIPWLIVLAQLIWLRRAVGPRINYALHLVWFLPVVYTQWIVAPALLGEHTGLLLLLTGGFGLYYTAADLVAVRSGTWFFDEKQISGVKLGGILPWEEIAFFFITSGLVAQSYLLLLPEDRR